MSQQLAKNDLTAVLYSAKDAKRFLKENPSADRVFTFTPDALATIKNIDIPLLTTLDTYKNYGQRRVLARVRRMEKQLNYDYADLKISLSSKETLRGQLHLLASFSSRLWETLKGTGPWLVPHNDGWEKIFNLQEAHQFLLIHINDQNPSTSVGIGRSFLSPFIRILNHIVLKIFENKQVVLITAYLYGLGSLSNDINQKFKHLKTMAVIGSSGKYSEVFRVLLSIFRILTGKEKITYTAVPNYSDKNNYMLEKFLLSVTDPVIKNALILLKETIVRDVIFTEGLNKDTEKLFKYTYPRAVLAHSLRWGNEAKLGEISLKHNVPCYLISHGSHPRPANIVSAYEHRDLAQGMLFSPLASNNFIQSPHTEKAILSYGVNYKCSNTKPLMWGRTHSPGIISKYNNRTILHAGTYKRWTRTRPWIYETSDEFVLGLKKLIKNVCLLENTKLIIRFRQMPECNIKTLIKLLPETDCYEIKTTGNFLEDLSGADLLVSYSSTTIEEALYYRRPVLLWGGSQRYMHLPASTKNPTSSSRMAIYAPQSELELLPMLKDVLDCHAGSPLTEEELIGHIWPENTPDRNDFIKQFMN